MKFYELISSVQTKRSFNGVYAIGFRNKYFNIIVKAMTSEVN